MAGLFERVHDELDAHASVEIEITYGTDVAETIFDVVDEVACSVLLAEKARDHSLLERLFG